ncbi:AlbA family DNA-binding domain-containing protein [Treponema sp. R80B11-R83G3]
MYFSDIFSITENDILNLITNKISEQKTLEFKRQLPDKNKDDEKIKLLQSIASFANTDGGIIIFGMKENSEGEASEIINIETSTDDDFLRLTSMVKDRISPRLNPPEFRELIVENKKIYIMCIHSSFTKPHYVNGNFVFYGRHSSGKYQLDISEIRALFLSSKSAEEQFENFRINRIMKLKSHSFPFKYYSDNFFVIHIASLNSINNNIQLSMPKIKLKNIELISNMYATGAISNYDGYLLYDFIPDGKIYSYVQIFRNGSIETTHFNLYNRQNEKIIYGDESVYLRISELKNGSIQFTDSTNAERLLKEHKRNIRYFTAWR